MAMLNNQMVDHIDSYRKMERYKMPQSQGDPRSIKARSATNSMDRGGRQDGNSSGGTHQGSRGKNGLSEIQPINHLGSTYHVNRTHKHT